MKTKLELVAENLSCLDNFTNLSKEFIDKLKELNASIFYISKSGFMRLFGLLEGSCSTDEVFIIDLDSGRIIDIDFSYDFFEINGKTFLFESIEEIFSILKENGLENTLVLDQGFSYCKNFNSLYFYETKDKTVKGFVFPLRNLFEILGE